MKGLSPQHILKAVAELDRGVTNPFGPPRRYELLYKGRRYPPKAVVGLAVKYLDGRTLTPKDFSAGERAGQANNILRRLGFKVVLKATQGDGFTYITCRSFRLPTNADVMETSLWFNMWQRRLLPYGELQSGNIVYWYDRFEKALVWKSRVTQVERLPYRSKANLKKQFLDLFGVYELSDQYFDKKANSGYCLAYTVKPLEKIRIPKPAGYRFPFSGWLSGNTQLAKEWLRDTVSNRKQIKSHNESKGNIRRPSSFDEYKRAYQYILDSSDRTIVPAHYNYQVHLKNMLTEHGVKGEFERGFVDVAFTFKGTQYIGEIKVTSTLPLAFAFRFALGQLLEYAHLKYERQPHMIMFLDQPLDAKRLAVATKLHISVVVKSEDRYRLTNPRVAPALKFIFRT